MIDQGLIADPQMLSHEYIRAFMNKRGGLYTHPKIIEFVKHIGHTSSHFFDQSGQHLIDKHIAKRQRASIDIDQNILQPGSEDYSPQKQ